MMRSTTTAGFIATLAALSLALGACSADESDSSSSSTTSKPTSTATTSRSATSTLKPRDIDAENGPNETIAGYIESAGIRETLAKPGEDGAPTIDLPTPAGWEDAGDQTPENAAGAIIYTGPEAQDANYTPNIVVILSKLSGNVEKQKLIALAGGEMRNLPEFSPLGSGGTPATLSGYPAYKIAGTYNLDGITAVTAQQTVVISGSDGIYVLQFNATSNDDQAAVLENATQFIDDNTTISF